MEETKEELIKSVLSLADPEIEYLQEATGLFETELSHSRMRFDLLFPGNQAGLENKARSLIYTSAFNGGLEFEPERIHAIKKAYSRLSEMSIEELIVERNTLRQYHADKEEENRPFNRPEAELKNLDFWVSYPPKFRH